MPPNLQEVKLKFARRRSAKVMGSLADRSELPQEGEEVRGILVTHSNLTSKIVAPQDLATYTPLRLGSIKSKLHVPFAGSIDTLRLFLTEMFAGVVETETEPDENGANGTTFSLRGDEVRCFNGFCAMMILRNTVVRRFSPSLLDSLFRQVRVIVGSSKGVVLVEWIASPAGDVIADSVVALIMHAQSSSASILLTSKPCRHARSEDRDLEDDDAKRQRSDGIDPSSERLRFLYATLTDQFQHVDAVYEGNRGTFEITTDSGLDSVEDDDGKLRCVVEVRLEGSTASAAEIRVESKDVTLASNVQACLQSVVAASLPIEL